MNGMLYGIGVGPGAEDLLTLRAVRVLGRVDVILAAASPKNDYSTALETARPHLRPDVSITRLEFPMTRDKAVLSAAWTRAAETTAALLRQGKTCAFLTIGDPLVYSTFAYLMRTLRACAPESLIEIIPGITSFQAAAAATGTVLCESGENLLILPGINDAATLKAGLKLADNAVILKAYRNFPVIRQTLEATGRLEGGIFASQVGLEGEQLSRDLCALPDKPPYLSLVLSKKPA